MNQVRIVARMERQPPRSIGGRKGLTREEIREGVELSDYYGQERPKTRDECRGGVRPCPFVSCQYNLYLDTKDRAVRVNFPHLEPVEMKWSCVLDEVESHPDGMTLELIGQRLNITRERVRQLEGAILRKLKRLAEQSDQLQMMIEAWEARRAQDTELVVLGI